LNRKPILYATLFLLALWIGIALVVHKPLLPPPWQVMRAFLIDLPHGLGWDILVSSWRILASMLAATAIGVPLGLWLGLNRRWDKYAYPLVYVTYPIPKITLLPIIILFLGIGDFSKIVLISLILVFQVLVIARDASRNIASEYVLSLKSLGANRWQLLKFVYLPATLPSTLTSLRLNVAVSIAVLYLAESFATMSGLGYYIMDTWQVLDYPRMYAGVMALSLIGAAAFIALAEIENRVCRWTQVGKLKHAGAG
jgi:ABC-type nitrate/sulfonate/bicarbonate transport system permease component